MYHDLGQKFMSPTINLWINSNEYLEFVKDFPYYMQCEIHKTEDDSKGYPVGVIEPDDDKHIPIHLYFQHYKTFEEAERKWNERKRRIDYTKVCFIWEFYDTLYDIRQAYEFDSLLIKKMLITHRKIEGLQSSYIVTCYDNDKPTAKILQLNERTGKRYLDEIDWVSFLNTV